MSTEVIPLVAGSEDILEGTIYDWVAGVRTAHDLTPYTSLSMKFSLNAGSTVSLTMVKDPDQETNPGKYTCQLGATTLPGAGQVELQAHLSDGVTTRKTQIANRKVERSL